MWYAVMWYVVMWVNDDYEEFMMDTHLDSHAPSKVRDM